MQGCLVSSAVDLAATTVLTAGKLAVKGTGALISAAIPDGDDDDEKAAKKAKKQTKQETEIMPEPANMPSENMAADGVQYIGD